MKISRIDFPKPLLDALRNGNLVIFAGAGVSAGPPAGLPGFRELAEAIAEGTGETLKDGEPEERFLGRLQQKGQKVHERAARLLLDKDPEPTDLHCQLLRLHPTLESVRIVTTNFDILFERAAERIFASMPEVFRAPALPLGSRFSGVVHVHGSIDSATDMVITDADFGKAYLSEGWARRFLLELFGSSSVLFVGYSHNDTIMNYLTRALPATEERTRFGLTDKASSTKWEFLGVEPVAYEKSSPEDYRSLNAGITGLANYSRRGVIEWQREIAEIASKPPSSIEEEMDLLEDALSDPVRTRFFTKTASTFEWVEWLEKNNHLDRLFDTSNDEKFGETDSELARWLAERFALSHANELFLLIGRRNMQVHPHLWGELGRVVSDKQQTIDSSDLSRWVSVLIATASFLPSTDDFVLFELGQRCIEAQLTYRVLDVFDVMGASNIRLERGLSISGDDKEIPVTVDLMQNCDHFEMNATWENGLKPNLHHIADLLLTRVIRHLEQRHRALHVWTKGEHWDTDSYHRTGIEPHEQDREDEAVDVLIDAARDCLKHLALYNQDMGADWCDRLVRSDVPLLRRLAVHTLAVRSDLTADQKIDWILATIGLDDLWAHHETFQVMRKIFPSASGKQQETVIKRILSQTLPSERGAANERIAAYRRFNWLCWLRDSDPSCTLVKQPLEDILNRYPKFRLGDYPDLTHYITVGDNGRPEAPWSARELLSRPAREWADDLLSFQEKDPFGPTRMDLMREVERAAIQRFKWGLDLADALADSGHWATDLWQPLIGAWERELDGHKHREVLNRLGSPQLYSNRARSVAYLLHFLVRRGGLPYTLDVLPQANQVAIALWPHLNEEELPADSDWLTDAMNHPAGILTDFWLTSVGLIRQQMEPKPPSLGDDYSQIFARIIQENTLAARLGKAVLGNGLSFILAIDEKWAKRHLIPLFERANEDREAVWDGFLFASLTPQVADALGNVFLKAVPLMGSLPSEKRQTRQRFIRRYVEMLTYFIDEPLESWIPIFFKVANVEDKCHLARAIGTILHGLQDQRQKEWWNRWLSQYWENRTEGVPEELDCQEVVEMLEWLPRLKTLYPSAVAIAVRMPKQTRLENSKIVTRINASNLWSEWPEETADLLAYVADCEESRLVWYQGKDLIGKLLKIDNLSTRAGGKLQEIQARLGL